MPEMSPELAAKIDYTEWIETLAVQVSESVQGTLLRGSRSVQVGTSSGGTARPLNSPGVLLGFALRNTNGGAPATVLLRDGEAGQVLIPLQLVAGECVRDWFGPGGVNLVNGLFVETVSGTVDGSVFLGGPQ